MTRNLAVAVVLATLLGSGVVHGLWTHRWKPAHELQVAAARLDEVPLTVGDWRGEPAELDAAQAELAGLAGSWMRRYTNRRGGATVAVLLMCGRPGPTSVHTPQWCYGGAGYELTGPEARCSVNPPGAAPAEFWAARFHKQGSYLRILWGWSGDGTWQAPDYPRLTLARFPALYKIYIIRELTNPHERPEDDPCLEFLRQFLPELSRSLFPATGPAAGGPGARGLRVALAGHGNGVSHGGGPGPDVAGTARCRLLEQGESDACRE